MVQPGRGSLFQPCGLRLPGWPAAGLLLPAYEPNLRYLNETSRHLNESISFRRGEDLVIVRPPVLALAPCVQLCVWTMHARMHTDAYTHTHAHTSIRFPQSSTFLTNCLQQQFLVHVLFFLMPRPMRPFSFLSILFPFASLFCSLFHLQGLNHSASY